MKKIIILLSLLLTLCLFVSCDEETKEALDNIGESPVEEPISTPEKTDSADNTGENDVNADVSLPSYDSKTNGNGNKYLGGGFAITDGEWIYYRSFSNGSYSMKKMSMDGTTVESIPGGDLRSLELKDGWLYGSYKGRNLVRVDIADRKEYKYHKSEDLNNYNTDDITFIGEWLYYCTNDINIDQNGIYKMKPDGSENTLVYGGGVYSQLKYDGEWIYFSNSGGEHYRMKPDATNVKSLSGKTFGYVVEDGIFYDKQGSHTDFSSVNSSVSMTLLDNTLYYCGNGTIYKQNKDGSNKTVIIEVERCNNLHVLGDWLFFYNQDTDNWYFCKTDGSGLKIAD